MHLEAESHVGVSSIALFFISWDTVSQLNSKLIDMISLHSQLVLQVAVSAVEY